MVVLASVVFRAVGSLPSELGSAMIRFYYSGAGERGFLSFT